MVVNLTHNLQILKASWLSSVGQGNLKCDWMSNISLQVVAFFPLLLICKKWSVLLSTLVSCFHDQPTAFHVFFNACWSQLLVNEGWSSRMFAKKIPVHTLHCVIKHPALHLGKINAHGDLAFFHLAVTVNGVLNGLASFLLSYSDRPVMHVLKEWDNISPYSFGDNTHVHGITW